MFYSILKSFFTPAFTAADLVIMGITVLFLSNYNFNILAVIIAGCCAFLALILSTWIQTFLYLAEVENNRVKKPISEIEE